MAGSLDWRRLVQAVGLVVVGAVFGGVNESLWHPAFPLIGLFSPAAPRYGGDNEAHYRALLHARMAVVLEERGSMDASRRELDKAEALDNSRDSEHWRRTAQADLRVSPPDGQPP
jgi:hypothetical protein